MKIQVTQGSIQEIKADTLIVNLFEGVSAPGGATGAVDKALGGAISELITSGDLTGKSCEVGVLYPHGSIPAKRVLVVGLGKQDELSLEGVRKAVATALKRGRDLNAREVASVVHGVGAGGLKMAEAAQATVEGALLGLYRFDTLKKDIEKKGAIEIFTLVEFEAAKLADVQAGARLAEIVVEGVYLARDLVNLPPNMATPTKMASVAQEIAGAYGMKITIGDRDWAAQHKMGAFLGVAKGAGEPPMA